MSVVSSVLIPIIKLWLRSQVEHIETIEIAIAAIAPPHPNSDLLPTTTTSQNPKPAITPKNDYYLKKQIYCRMFGIEFIIKKIL